MNYFDPIDVPFFVGDFTLTSLAALFLVVLLFCILFRARQFIYWHILFMATWVSLPILSIINLHPILGFCSLSAAHADPINAPIECSLLPLSGIYLVTLITLLFFKKDISEIWSTGGWRSAFGEALVATVLFAIFVWVPVYQAYDLTLGQSPESPSIFAALFFLLVLLLGIYWIFYRKASSSSPPKPGPH